MSVCSTIEICYNRYVKRGGRECTESPQLRKYEQVFVEQMFGSRLSSATERSIGDSARGPRVPIGPRRREGAIGDSLRIPRDFENCQLFCAL